MLVSRLIDLYSLVIVAAVVILRLVAGIFERVGRRLPGKGTLRASSRVGDRLADRILDVDPAVLETR